MLLFYSNKIKTKMNEDTTATPQPLTPPAPVQNQPAPETQPVPSEPTPTVPSDQPAKPVHPLMKKVDTLMGMGVIGISLAATLLAFALFANLY
jgi:hypothetical protein